MTFSLINITHFNVIGTSATPSAEVTWTFCRLESLLLFVCAIVSCPPFSLFAAPCSFSSSFLRLSPSLSSECGPPTKTNIKVQQWRAWSTELSLDWAPSLFTLSLSSEREKSLSLSFFSPAIAMRKVSFSGSVN